MHARVIEETGGVHGVRDVGLLISASERPKASFGGQESYPDIFKKAAAYLEALVRYHVFVDGNKRTSVITAARFLYINKYLFRATNSDIERFVVRIAIERLDVDRIAEWLRSNARNK
jgi:death-on-curing protein